MNKTMVSKNDLEKLGFKSNQAMVIVKRAKVMMVNKGYELYNNKRVGVVPRSIVEDIIGVPLSTLDN